MHPSDTDLARRDDHARHDLLLIAGHAAGDLSGTQAVTAASLVESCSTCAEVHRDIVALAAATRALPHDARAPRDFRLDADQAVALRRGSWLRALLRPFASARSATRPLAAGFTSLGVAGLLLAAVASGFSSTAGLAPEREFGAAAGGGVTAAPALQPAGDPDSAATDQPRTNVEAGDSDFDAGLGGDLGTDKSGGEGDDGRVAGLATPSNLLVIGSLGFLGLGLALFGLRIGARRLR